MKTILKVLVGAGLASIVTAQTQDIVVLKDKLERAADEAKKMFLFNQQTVEFVSAQMVSGPPVKSAPYSAEAVNETIQTLADGNRIVQRTTAMQYRDNDGRERREEISAMGAIFISDPVAKTRYTLHPDSKTAETGPMVINFKSDGPGNTFFYVSNGAAVALPGVRSGPVPAPGLFVERTEGGLGRGIVTGGAHVALTGDSKLDAKTEELGKMFIEGVQAEGTRTTTTIPAGEIGNDRPINIVDERWYSPDLQMTILTRHTDPRTGETNFALKNVNRSSPPPYLFEVPSDYTVSAGGGRGGRGVAHETRE